MSERSRRMRRQISEITEDSSDQSEADSDDFDPRKSDASRRAGRIESASSTPASRSRRVTANGPSPFGGTRGGPPGSDDKKQSIKLTMKVAPSKLREVMRANELEALQDTLGGGKVIDGPRSTRRAAHARTAVRTGGRPRYVEYAESEIEDEEDQDAEQDVVLDDFDEIGAEAEGGTDEDEEEDIDMEDAPLPSKRAPSQPKAPKITLKAIGKADGKQQPKPKLVVTPANVGPVQSVEDQEMEDEPDDNEVENSSDLSENEENTNLNDEEGVDEDEDEDVEDEEEDGEGEEDEGEEGEEEDEEIGEEDDEEEGLEDSEDENPASGMATPDPGKMTQRQRGRLGEPLMALDMAPQQRKFFTDAEKAMKKDEHARKRKELTKRKIHEEKTAALNRLLKPQVSKSRGAAPKAENLAANLATALEEDEIEVKADPLYTRWISDRNGIKLGIPEEWLGKHVGEYFGPPISTSNGALVQEVE